MLRLGAQKFSWIWLAPVLVFGLAYLLGRTEVVRQFEWRTLDWRTKLRVYFQPPADPRIAVVLYDDSTESDLAPWPPDRGIHADFLRMMAALQPKVITYDIITDAVHEGEGDAKMAAVVAAAARKDIRLVTAGVTVHDDPQSDAPGQEGPTRPFPRIEGNLALLQGDDFAIRPFPLLRAVSLYGFADTPAGADGYRREIPLVVRAGKQAYPSLAMQTLLAYLKVPVDQVRVKLGDAITVPTSDGDLRIPISAAGRFLLNYRYDRSDEFGDDFLTYSYIDTMRLVTAKFVDHNPQAPKPPDFAGRIVFVGEVVTGKADVGPSPLNGFTPLVLIHANLLNNILTHDFARRLPVGWAWLGVLLFGYVGLVVGQRRAMWVVAAFVLLSVAIYVELAFGAWIRWSLWLPLTWPLAGFLVLQFMVIGRRVIVEQRGKQEIKGMFGSYVSPQYVDRLINSGEKPQLGGHDEIITPYFSDIQKFSSFSEMLTSQQLGELLNEYLTACTDIVQEEGGTLDKYIGDAVVAMFGAPIALPDHACRACVTALRVQSRLGELRTKWKSEGAKWPEIVWKMQTRIGLNTGMAMIGNFGSRTRFNYSMMGDNVNLAARMESGAKSWGAYTMCTDATRLACEKYGGERIVFRPLGRIVVQGRTQAVPIHEIVGLKESLAASVPECLGLFVQGLERHYLRDWDGALALFRRSAELEPNYPGRTPGVGSNPSLVYLGIVEQYKITPPPPDWDGVFVMKEK